MGVGVRTLYEWKNKYPQISQALKDGKEVVGYAVENALLQAAMNGNVTAAMYWLNNRRPDKYRRNPIGANPQQKESASKLFEALEDEGK